MAKKKMARGKYRSSDRTHVKPTRWTKAERAEWAGQQREQAARVMASIERGDCRNALAILLMNERLEAGGITTIEHLDARRAVFNSCLKQK